LFEPYDIKAVFDGLELDPIDRSRCYVCWLICVVINIPIYIKQIMLHYCTCIRERN